MVCKSIVISRRGNYARGQGGSTEQHVLANRRTHPMSPYPAPIQPHYARPFTTPSRPTPHHTTPRHTTPNTQTASHHTAPRTPAHYTTTRSTTNASPHHNAPYRTSPILPRLYGLPRLPCWESARLFASDRSERRLVDPAEAGDADGLEPGGREQDGTPGREAGETSVADPPPSAAVSSQPAALLSESRWLRAEHIAPIIALADLVSMLGKHGITHHSIA